MSRIDMKDAIEYIPGRLYYVALHSEPRQSPTEHFFSIDDIFIYWNFYLDFGPLCLGHLYRFCQLLNNELSAPALRRKKIYYYSGCHPHKKANAIYLLSAYGVLYLNKTPEEAYRPFQGLMPRLQPFHDASPGICTYDLTVLDVIKGLYKAYKNKFFDFTTFNVEEYEYYDKVENGDFNWIVNGKFLAFAGPHNTNNDSPEGYITLTPEDYISYFKSHNIKLVIQLNKKNYDPNRFIKHGINHKIIYYLDGSIPPNHLLKLFIETCEKEPNAIAVHCKAGLGRTGTCIGAYIMKHYGFTAAEVIGYIRVCRPGSIIGPQQQYLCSIQDQMWTEGGFVGNPVANASLLSSGMNNLTISTAAANRESNNKDERKDGSAYRTPLNRSYISQHTAVDEKGRSQGDHLVAMRSPKSEKKSGYK